MNDGLFEVGFTYQENGQTIRKAAYVYPEGTRQDNFDAALISMVNFCDWMDKEKMDEFAKKLSVLTLEDRDAGEDWIWEAWYEAVNRARNDLSKVYCGRPYLWDTGIGPCDNAILVDLDREELVIEYSRRPVGRFPLCQLGGFAGKWNCLRVVREAEKLIEEEEFKEFIRDHRPKVVERAGGYSVVIDGQTDKVNVKARLRRRGFKKDMTGWHKDVSSEKHANGIKDRLNEEAEELPEDEIYKGRDEDKKEWMIIKTTEGYVPVPKTEPFLEHAMQDKKDILYEFKCDGLVHALNVCREWETREEAK